LSDDAVVVTVAEAQQLLGVGKVTIYRWLSDGFLTLIGEQLTAGAPWRVRIDQAVRERLAPAVPRAGSGSQTPRRPSKSPARPCCTRSNAENSRPSTSTKDDEKVYVST
jgi:predicted DNA-binding transcriptional regulator AlpA